MSGGVDSSVVAALLVEQGYDVTGAYMINYDDAPVTPPSLPLKRGGECWREDYNDAIRVAAKLGIPLLKLDFRQEYKSQVLDYMYKEYEAGRTPNPDVMCNKFIKFGAWLDKIKELGFDKMATGHYASLSQKSIKSKVHKVNLMCAKDSNKDQTYFLHQLNQNQLSHTLFPLGKYTKDEVRELAKKFDLPTANKEESMGICFVGEVSMKEFLENKIKDKIKGGDIVLSNGEKIGKHDGLAFYTIGQRQLRVQSRKSKVESGDNKPLYVVEKNFKKNELIVGYEDDPLLYKSEAQVENVHWIGQEPKFPLKCKVRLRHRQELKDCVVEGDKVIFNKPERAVTPGQFAVFYLKNECLGGGIVK